MIQTEKRRGDIYSRIYTTNLQSLNMLVKSKISCSFLPLLTCITNPKPQYNLHRQLSKRLGLYFLVSLINLNREKVMSCDILMGNHFDEKFSVRLVEFKIDGNSFYLYN